MQVQRQFVEVTDRRLVIELPESFVNHRVELIALTADDDLASQRPHPGDPRIDSTLTPVAWDGFAEGFTGFSEDFGIAGEWH
ncbi:hypothetical protein [Thiocystis violacea]|uniref:hypothetical protein n=1 Tax=Thiocystis violacea TaxID=13725 RepID=UPI00190444A7|nr:hypothetical protein [Thiocystis violacea]MBK1720566.1 hypothetical protein [Thiocystis violacea]